MLKSVVKGFGFSAVSLLLPLNTKHATALTLPSNRHAEVPSDASLFLDVSSEDTTTSRVYFLYVGTDRFSGEVRSSR